ncbi:MAG: ABC transporter permease [Clostridia bacterium]|nr:ABC transporter permease [Clostridia bacterium]
MKRLTVNTFALQSLRKRKKKYAALIAGIILAMVFSSGTLFLLASLFSGIDDLTAQAFGNENAVFYGLTEETLADGRARFHIESTAQGEVLGYLSTGDEDRGVSVAKLTPEAQALTYTVVTEGAYPQNAGEIAVEEDALIRMGLHARPGDTLTLTLQVQNGAGYLPVTVQKSYLLTGILKDRRVNVEYMRASKSLFPAAFVSDKETVEPGGKPLPVTYAVFSRGSGPTNSSYQFYYDFCKAHEEINDAYESVFISRDSYSLSGIGKLQQSGVLASVLAAVFTVVSCVGIVNAFSSDLQDRKKQIGMLRALGATKIQIVRIFGREAFLIALCSAPFSLLLSYFGTRLAVRLIGNGLRFLLFRET